MLITEKFERVFYRLCAISVGLSLFYLILFWSGSVPDYRSEPNYFYLFLTIAYQMAIPIGLWWGVAQLTGERRGSFIAGAIQSLMAGYVYYRSFADYIQSHEYSFSTYLNNSAGLIVAVAVFALFYFKDIRKIVSFFVLVTLVLIGLYNTSRYDYAEFVENFYLLFGEKHFLTIRLTVDTRIFRNINVFMVFLSNLRLPVSIAVLWYLVNKIKDAKAFDYQQLSIPEALPMKAFTFSLMHWVMRLTLFALAFGAGRQLQMIAKLESTIGSIVVLTAILVALYVVSVIYRNFLAAYFVSRAKYPSWCYLFLNLPFVHVIAWGVAVTMPASKSVDYGNEQMIREDVSATFSALKMQFTQNKNAGILTFMLIIIILYTIVTSLNIRSGIGSQKTIIVAMGIVSILLLLWYKSNNRAVYYILIIEAVCLFIAMLLGHIKLMTPFIFLGLSNYIIYYSLFHFDQFILISEEEETTPMAISSS